jgi:excisionase family DNA binding protein
MIDQGLLTVKELSSYLGVSPCAVYRMVEKGEIPLIRRQGLGLRFQKEAIDVWLDKSSKKPVPILDGSVHPLTMPPVCHIKGSHAKTGGTGEMAKAKSKTRYSSVYGAIYQRKTKDGRIRWYLDYRDELGKRIQRVAVNAQTAEEAGLALQTEVKKAFDRAQGVKEKKRIVFNDFAPLYIDNYAKPNKRSWRCDDYCIKAHLKPYFGKLDLGTITPLDVERFRAQRLEAGIKKSTSNRELALLKRMFHLASDWGYSADNPVAKVKLFSERDNLKERVLTADEETKLLAHCAPHLRPIVVFALNTGMRRGEILGLRWDQVDPAGKSVLVKRTKSGRDRSIPLNEAAAGVIKAQRTKSHGTYVFPSTKGREFMRTVDHSFGRACRLAGIVGLRFHDLRHTFATRLIRRGVDIITVQALLGHYAVTVTQRYTHTGADEKRRAVEALGRASESLLHGGDTPVTEKSGVQVTDSSVVN